MAEVDVGLTGPLFDGRAQAAVEGFAEDIEQRTAEALAENVRLVLDRSTRNATGRYRNTVHAERAGMGWSATDGGTLPYGPWLEGVAQRNKTSSFRGYHGFQLAQQAVEKRVDRIAEDAFPAHKRRME